MRLVAGAAGAAVIVTGSAAADGGWLQPNGDVRGARAAASTSISSGTVAGLTVRWRFHIPGGSSFGALASTPLIAGGHRVRADARLVRLRSRRAHREDSLALAHQGSERRSERTRSHSGSDLRRDGHQCVRARPPHGPSCLGATPRLEIRAVHGHRAARRRRARLRLDGRVRSRWTGGALRARPAQREGALAFPDHPRAVASSLGRRRRRLVHAVARRRTASSTSASRTPIPGEGRACARTAAPMPARRSTQTRSWRCAPPPGSFSGTTRCASTTCATTTSRPRRSSSDGRVYGAGKAGRVVAWNRLTGKRLWSQSVGTHLHDLGPLPVAWTTVCPGLWGGVLTPMSYAARAPLRSGRGPLHAGKRRAHACAQRPSHGRRRGRRDRRDERKEALGAPPRRHRRPVAPPLPAMSSSPRRSTVVCMALAAGSGKVLWQTLAPAGINACPAVSGDLLVVGAGAPRALRVQARACRLRARGRAPVEWPML